MTNKLKAANRARILAVANDQYAALSSDDIVIPDDAEIDFNTSRGMWVSALVYVRAEDVRANK